MKHDELDILGDEDATLMLYVAGELDEGERAAFDVRVGRDVALATRLRTLSGIDEMLREDARGDSITDFESRQALASTLRSVRNQALAMQDRPALRIGSRRLTAMPRWAWAAAAAACVGIGFVMWATNSEPSQFPSPIARRDRTVGQDGLPIFNREYAGISAAFARIDPADSEDPTADVDNQVEALNVLATMNDLN